jgi:very-short-patch-repair endonuclease
VAESVNRLIAELAARQHGVVARWQLLESGFDRRAIDRRIASGLLQPLYRGVYAVGHPNVSAKGHWMAAALACGPRAVVSHRSAAALWDLASSASALVDITVPRGRAGHNGIRPHGVRHLHDRDRTLYDVIPVTTVARTLFDLAEVMDATRLERAFERAERLQLLDLAAVEDVCRRSHGRRALRPVRTLLPSLRPAPATRSDLERDFLDLCRDHGLPEPEVNAIVEGFEVDAVWRAHRLVVELDSFEYHRSRAAFEQDRARDTALQLAGYRVMRITWRRLRDEPATVAQEVGTMLDRPPAPGRGPD